VRFKKIHIKEVTVAVKNVFVCVRFWLVYFFVVLLPSYAFAFGDPYGGFGSASMSMGERIKQHLLAAFFGALLGAFFSQKLRQFRRWLLLAIVGLGLFLALIGSPATGNIASFIAGFIIAWYALREVIEQVRKKREKITTFGSAEWANLEHLQQNGLIGSEGFILGFYEENGQKYPLQYKKDRHLMTVAPTRAGKGVSAIIPNLLTYKGSVLVIDPKGENARITKDRRGQGDPSGNIPGLGQDVHIIDPWGITGFKVSHFNPLDWLNPNDENISENAMILADSMIPPRQNTLEPFWDDEAKALLMGLLLYVALAAQEEGNRNLGRVREIICLSNDDFKDVLLRMRKSSNPIVASTAARTISKEEKLRSNVLSSLQAHTHFLDSPRIRRSLKKSDFKFEDLKTKKMTVYLVLPADRIDAFGRWLRLLIQQAITVNARNIETKPEKPILFILDEMAALNRLTMVEQAYSLMAGFGMQLWGIVQDLSQLEKIYGKGWETFIGNSGVLQYFGSRDHKTAEYFSKLCGVTTIVKFSITNAIARAFSSSTGQGGGNSSSSTTHSDSTTLDIAQRNLAYPDELMVLRENKQLVLIENFNPIPGKKVTWYDDADLKTLGKNLQ
jgi:type IV secretion system protein VirD4